MKTNMKKQTKTKQRRTSVTTNSIVDDACDDERQPRHTTLYKNSALYISRQGERSRERQYESPLGNHATPIKNIPGDFSAQSKHTNSGFASFFAYLAILLFITPIPSPTTTSTPSGKFSYGSWWTPVRVARRS
jgi:hypothetical protein